MTKDFRWLSKKLQLSAEEDSLQAQGLINSHQRVGKSLLDCYKLQALQSIGDDDEDDAGGKNDLFSLRMDIDRLSLEQKKKKILILADAAAAGAPLKIPLLLLYKREPFKPHDETDDHLIPSSSSNNNKKERRTTTIAKQQYRRGRRRKLHYASR